MKISPIATLFLKITRRHMKFAILTAFFALVASTIFAQAEPSKEDILATQAAIRKQRERVPYDIYKKVVPTYVTSAGELTERGKAATEVSGPAPTAAPAATPEPVVPEPVPQTAELPPKSSIAIKETPSEIPAPTPKPGSKCKMAHHLVTYTPTIILGADAQGEPVTWKFYAGIRNTAGKGLQLVSEKTLIPGDPIEIAPIVQDASEWECSCCRRLNKEFPKMLGWYAEVVQGDKVIAQARPSGVGFEMAALVEQKPEVPQSPYHYELRFTSPDAPKASPQPAAAAPTTPAHIATASRSKMTGATRMKGPSGSLYVSDTPLLTPDDVLSASPSSPIHKKIDKVTVRLKPSGIEKLTAASNPELLLVVVSEGKIVADEVREAAYVTKDTIIVEGRFSEDEFRQIAQSLRPPPGRASR